MVTIKPVWTENVALHTSAALAAAASVVDDIDLATLGADQAVAVIEIIFGGTPDGDVLIEIFHSADSGVNDNTEPDLTYRIGPDATNTKRRGIIISGVPYSAIRVTNNDTTDNVTYEAWYAWRNWDSS